MILIPNGVITAFAAGSITAADYLRNSEWGSKHFSAQGYGIYRPGAASSADYFRPVGDLTNTTGLLAHLGANYTDTTVGTEAVELWKGRIRPDVDVHNAINRVLNKLMYSTFIPLSDLSNADGDMAATTDTNWTDVGTPTTSAKATTATYTPYGLRSYHLVGDAADEGTRSAAIGIRSAKSVRAFAICSAVTGTASLNFYDNTASAVLTGSTAITHDEIEPQLMSLPWTTVGTSTKQVSLNLTSTSAASDMYWNMAWLYRLGNRLINLPAYISENYQSPSIFQARPTYAGNDTNVYDALALDFVELQEGKDYTLVSHQPDANPHAVYFLNDAVFDWPLFVEARVPYSYLGTLSAESDTTVCPLKLLLPAAKQELIKGSLITRPPFKGDSVIAAQLILAQQEYDRASVSRKVKPAAKAIPWWGGPMRRGL